MITLARPCQGNISGFTHKRCLVKVKFFLQPPRPRHLQPCFPGSGHSFLEANFAFQKLGHDLQKDVLWEFPLKDSFISSRNKAGVFVIFPSISHLCTNHAQPCLASGISQGWNILVSMAINSCNFFFPGETCYSKLHAGLQIAMILIYFFSQ